MASSRSVGRVRSCVGWQAWSAKLVGVIWILLETRGEVELPEARLSDPRRVVCPAGTAITLPATAYNQALDRPELRAVRSRRMVLVRALASVAQRLAPLTTEQAAMLWA